MNEPLKSKLAKCLRFFRILPLICIVFSSCEKIVEEEIHVPIVITYQNMSGVKVGIYNSNLRLSDNFLAAVPPKGSQREQYIGKEKIAPNRDDNYYLQFYFPVYKIEVPLVLPAGKGDMINSNASGTTMLVNIPLVRSWFAQGEILSAITNAYIVIKNEYGSPIVFRRNTTPLEREDEDENRIKKEDVISYNESALYKIPAGPITGYNIHNGIDQILLPASVTGFSGGMVYLFNYSLSGISFVESKLFTLTDLGINENQW